MTLFNRFAQVTLNSANEIRSFKDVRITFDIEKTSEGTPNPAKIMLYNLNQDSFSFVQKNNLKVVLEAGYIGFDTGDRLVSRIFVGDVKEFKMKKDKKTGVEKEKGISFQFEKKGPDFIMNLECGDSENKIINAKINKSYSNNIELKRIIEDLAASLGVPIGTIDGIPTKKFIHGTTLSGPSRDYLDTLLGQEGLDWSIQDGELIIKRVNAINQDEAILLNQNTGLLDIPSKTKQGVNFRMLINPLIKPGVTVKLESKFVTGFFNVKKANFKGDTHGNDWEVEVEAINA